MDTDNVDRILEKHAYQQSEIIGIMQDLQGVENYLSEDVLRYVSKRLELRLTRIFDIATFYKSFSLVPRGRHTIKVCCGTACHLGGAARNLEQVKRLLNVEEGETTDDHNFSLETVNCLGTCALAPVIVVGDDYYDAVHPGKIEKILTGYNAESEGLTVEED
ncbi:MAG: NAD(P)H-dependent oxidoreductase subunit E [Thermodesulfobacteriota bacterium]